MPKGNSHPASHKRKHDANLVFPAQLNLPNRRDRQYDHQNIRNNVGQRPPCPVRILIEAVSLDRRSPQRCERNALREVGDNRRNGGCHEDPHEHITGDSVPSLDENAEEEREHRELGKGHREQIHDCKGDFELRKGGKFARVCKCDCGDVVASSAIVNKGCLVVSMLIL